MGFTVQPWTLDGSTRSAQQSYLVPLSAARSLGGQLGANGGGTCDSFGPDSFNGQPWQQVTMVLEWFSDSLRFLVYKDVIALDAIPSSSDRLIASWVYTGARPTAGNPPSSHWHVNMW